MLMGTKQSLKAAPTEVNLKSGQYQELSRARDNFSEGIELVNSFPAILDM